MNAHIGFTIVTQSSEYAQTPSDLSLAGAKISGPVMA
jgi:hypothetical protein